MAIQDRLYTADDLWAMSKGKDEKRFELIRGVLVEVSPSNKIHSILAAWIAYLLLAFVDPNDLGEVTGEIGGYTLASDTVLAPDVGFISKSRYSNEPPSAFVSVAPDLAVEIMSPSNTATEMNDKVLLYLKAGTRLIWIVYPTSKTVTVYKPSGEAALVDLNGVLDGGDVLPGFSLPVREIFKKLRE